MAIGRNAWVLISLHEIAIEIKVFDCFKKCALDLLFFGLLFPKSIFATCFEPSEHSWLFSINNKICCTSQDVGLCPQPPNISRYFFSFVEVSVRLALSTNQLADCYN